VLADFAAALTRDPFHARMISDGDAATLLRDRSRRLKRAQDDADCGSLDPNNSAKSA
jgi:hypothetical protein